MVLAFAAGLDGDVPANQPFGKPPAQDHRVFGFLMPLQRGQAQLGRTHPHILAAHNVVDAALFVIDVNTGNVPADIPPDQQQNEQGREARRDCELGYW